ncbi:MAG: T9SS type A sorting domain-containing protein [Cyclobacteriaceae bacterium]
MRSKKYHSLLALALLLNSIQLTAQEVMSSQGDSYVSETARVDFTIGEVLVESYSTNLIRYTQGFHQSYVVQLPLGSGEIRPEVNVLIYPNPASNFLKIETENSNGARYFLHDLMGKLVNEGTLSTASTTVDISNLADGAFRLSIADQSGKTLNSFLVVKKK